MNILKKRVVGLEINDTCMHAVELSGSYQNPEIINYGKKLLAPGVVKEGKIIDAESVKTAIEEMWREIRIKSREIILGANNEDVIIRFLKLPRIEREKIGNFIRFQASDYIPFNIEEFELDYMVTGEQKTNEGDFYSVLLVAARKNMLYEYLKTFESTRLLIRDIKSSTLVLDIFLPQEYKNQACVIVNLSFGVCNILIMDKNVPVFARTVMMGRKDNTEDIASIAAGEIRSSVFYFQSQNRSAVVRKVFLLGGEVTKSGIKESIRNIINIDTEVLMPFEYLYRKTAEQDQKELHATEYAVAFSLALHGLKGVN
ncbi:MAG: pilus assembly protein PilM [Firmicutes bacterium]|nr:pilus assembly protein PilM [Bacillota bacterium]